MSTKKPTPSETPAVDATLVKAIADLRAGNTDGAMITNFQPQPRTFEIGYGDPTDPATNASVTVLPAQGNPRKMDPGQLSTTRAVVAYLTDTYPACFDQRSERSTAWKLSGTFGR
jgi:hypothetical protein